LLCKSGATKGWFLQFFRPNDAADEGIDMSNNESRNAADESFRRRLIANLAEHILFSQ
jgi:glycerol-3-phosphate O-acyltransferase 1/2